VKYGRARALYFGSALWLVMPMPLYAAAGAGSEAPAVAPAPPSGKPAPDVETLDPGTATSLLGKKVVGAKGENMGLVVDVIVASDGTPRAAVIDFGGFLGVGSRKIAIAWSLLHFELAKHDAPLLVDLSRAALQAAPEYKEAAAPLQILTSPAGAKSGSSDDSR
jgi:hypothetical protein